ncbi:hypothetical protein BDW71DRAFT_171905 [Aspergillus fruticulosus]
MHFWGLYSTIVNEGTCRIELKSMTLSAPVEVLTEIDVWIPDIGSLHIALKTSYGRQLHFSQSGTYGTMTSLQAPPGLYWWINFVIWRYLC